MNYPKPVMKATELEKMGFQREFLLYAFRRKGQTYATAIYDLRDHHLIALLP